MEPFDPEHRCPKCAAVDATVEHVSAIDEPFRDMLGFQHEPRDERLDLTCGRCGYAWESETADAKVASR